MKTKIFISLIALLLCLVILHEVLPVRAETKQASTPEPAVDLGAFTKEIMQLKMTGDQSELAMWFPFEFYVESSWEKSNQTREDAEKDVEFIKPYLTIIVQCSLDQADGSSLYSSEKEVRARAVLLLPDGTEIHPLDKVPPTVAATVAAIKALMSAEGDAGGANMHVLVFPSKDKQGNLVVDTKKISKLNLQLKADRKFGNCVFTWRTPFDATTSAPPCQKCKESVSAKWSFCPWCGNKLVD